MRPFRSTPPTSLVLFLLLGLLLAGCAGVAPDPRYTSDERGEDRGRDRESPPPRGSQPPSSGRVSDNLDSTIEGWWGAPYRSGGNSKHGVDCSAYVQAVYRAVWNKSLPRTTATQFQQGVAVNRNALRRGDLVFFDTSGRGVSHVGIYIGGGRFTHASNSRGVTIDELDAPYYRKRYLGARRIP